MNISSVDVTSRVANTTATHSVSVAAYILASLTILFALGTLVVNGLFIVAITRYRILRTSFNVYALNLSICDILCASFNMTSYIAANIFGGWPFGANYCHFYTFIRIVIFSAAEHALTAISVDRMWSLYWPGHYRRHHTIRTKSMICVGIWVYVMVVCSPYVILDRVLYSKGNPSSLCYFNVEAQREYTTVISMLMFVLPLIVLFMCYFLIGFRVRYRRVDVANTFDLVLYKRQQDVQRMERQINMHVGVLLTAGAVCWTPVIVHFVLGNFIHGFSSPAYFAVAQSLLYFDCVLQPFVYHFRLPNVRKCIEDQLSCGIKPLS